MKIHSENSMLMAVADLTRGKRDVMFDRLQERIDQVAAYLNKAQIRDVVIGLSGGIDSTFAYLILQKVRENYINDLRIHAMFFDHSIHNNKASCSLVDELVRGDEGTTLEVVNLQPFVYNANIMISLNGDCHTQSQFAYAMMYTLMFGVAQRENAITIGTTNLDEMGFVGWFGKNSDMMTDLQIISDFHKFEINHSMLWFLQAPANSEKYGVHQKIREQPPKGDLLSGLTDEEVFDCSYNELAVITDIMMKCPEDCTEFLRNRYKKVFSMHEHNKHKYQGQTFNPVFLKSSMAL